MRALKRGQGHWDEETLIRQVTGACEKAAVMLWMLEGSVAGPLFLENASLWLTRNLLLGGPGLPLEILCARPDSHAAIEWCY